MDQEHESNQAGAPQVFRPGDMVSLDTRAAAPPEDHATLPEPVASQTPVPTPPSPTSIEQPVPVPTPFTVTSDESSQLAPQPGDEQDQIAWSASEFIAHDKSPAWYGALALATVVIAAGVFLLTKDKISTGVIIIAAIALGIYAARKPRQLQYALNTQGIHIGERYFAFDQFRSFTVADEGALATVAFTPLKRFGQLVTIYFDPKDEDAIVGLLSDRLPMDHHRRDMLDNFMKRIRF